MPKELSEACRRLYGILDCMAFWIVLQNKTSFGVKSIIYKKDLLNLIWKYEGLVTRAAFPKNFGGVN
jgi:hypothetical protein